MHDHLLRTTLRANAAISATWGTVAVLGAGVLADPLGVPAAASVAVGLVAIVAAGLFHTFAGREVLAPAEGWLATVGDALFGGTLVAAALLAPDVTTLGRWVVGISGAAVLDLAVLEFVGTRRLAPSPTPAAA